jgi:hypothetical protein
MHLHFAGSWAAATLAQLPNARGAANTGDPSNFGAQGAAQSALLAFYLALEHVRAVARHASAWITLPLMEAAVLDDYYQRATAFRDALIHLANKSDRPWDRVLSKQRAKIAASPPGSLPAPMGYIGLGLYFEGGRAILWAAPGKGQQERRRHELSWDEIQAVTSELQRWVLAVLATWDEHEGYYNKMVEEHNKAWLEAEGHAGPDDRPEPPED